MVSLNQLVAVCLMYVAGLFIVAFAAERAALRGRGGAGFPTGLKWSFTIVFPKTKSRRPPT